MKNLLRYLHNWELLLIPIVATLGISVNLFYSSMVLSDGNNLFKAIHDSDFPILEEAINNLNRFDAIMVALNSGATTGELEFLSVANKKAAEIQASYEALAKLDTKHKNEIEGLISEFNAYFASAMDISLQIATKSGEPSYQQIAKMRSLRDTYMSGSVEYRNTAERYFREEINEAIRRSERAQVWGWIIGMLMLLVIIALTLLVRRDIAKRKQIMAALRDSEEASRIAAISFETHDAIAITDPNANIIRVNRAFTDITGYGADEVVGRNFNIMKSDRHEKSFYSEMWQQLLQSGTWSGEIWNRRRNGEIYPKEITITAVKNGQNKTTHYVAIFSDITERKQNEEEIHNLAFFDPLTKLPNRRLFLDRLQIALITSARRDDYGAVLFIDLDRFKSLNDTLGHDYGDLLLIEVGARIKSSIREMDTVSRYGGDEFVILIEAISDDLIDAKEKAEQFAEKIRNALVQPYTLKRHEHHSSPSIGISLYHGNNESPETVLEHADIAMYQAKQCGRNAVRCFDSTMQQDKPAYWAG